MFALLTNCELELESGQLIGKQVKYQHSETLSTGIIVEVLSLQIYHVKLDDGSIIKTHHNFITLSKANHKEDKLSALLACELNNQIHHEAMLGIPSQNESLTNKQNELLSWHYRLGHMSFQSPEN